MQPKRSRNIVTFFVILHVLALVGLWFFFTWMGVLTFVVLSFVTSLGVTVGYHRLLTHGGFQTWKPIRYALAIAGLLSGQGPPTLWVADHRKHHKYADREGDPHSPNDGGFHAHMGWMTLSRSKMALRKLVSQFAPDLSRDKFMRYLHRSYIYWHVGLAVLLIAIGYATGGWKMAGSLFIYGFLLRMVWVFHTTWAVNSVTHMWGYRNYETSDKSKNNIFVALVAHGEGWHNNHHQYPTLVWHGHRWWERCLDLSGQLIWLMKQLHLIWDVDDCISEH